MPHHVATASSTDNPNLVPPLRLQTRKRPLSEKIDYSDMIAEETESGERGRGKARATSGGGTRGGGAGRGRGAAAGAGVRGGKGRGKGRGRGYKNKYRRQHVCSVCFVNRYVQSV